MYNLGKVLLNDAAQTAKYYINSYHTLCSQANLFIGFELKIAYLLSQALISSEAYKESMNLIIQGP